MAVDKIETVPSVAETPKYVSGILNGGSSFTVTCTSFVGVFGYDSSHCALYICRSNFIVPLVNTGSPITITQSNGTYTITNVTTSYGIRYFILYY